MSVLFLLTACGPDNTQSANEKTLEPMMVGQLQITEALQDAEGSKPWFELYNPGIYDMSLDDVMVYLYDDDGQMGDPIALGYGGQYGADLIHSGEYLAFEVTDPNFVDATKMSVAMKNSFDIDGALLEPVDTGISYQRSFEDGEYSLHGWCASNDTVNPVDQTRGAPNGVCPSDQSPSCTAEDILLKVKTYSSDTSSDWIEGFSDQTPVFLGLELENTCSAEFSFIGPGEGCLEMGITVTPETGSPETGSAQQIDVTCRDPGETVWTMSPESTTALPRINIGTYTMPGTHTVHTTVRIEDTPIGDSEEFEVVTTPAD